MSNIQWELLLASSLVAAGTTIAVEVVAKPWLEVRKDRIVRGVRERAEISFELYAIQQHLQGLSIIYHFDDQDKLYRELIEIRAILRRLQNLPLENFAWLGISMAILCRSVLGYITAMIDTPEIFDPRKAFDGEVQRLFEKSLSDLRFSLDLPVGYALTPRYRYFRRRRMQAIARFVMDCGPPYIYRVISS